MLRKIVSRDFPVFSGLALESYFHRKLAESGSWTRLGSWWDRKGENEIDLIAENELDGTLLVAEIKRDKDRIDLMTLGEKHKAFAKASGLKKTLKLKLVGLSLEDM